MNVSIPASDLIRLLALAEVGANGMMHESRTAAIMAIRAAEALLVTETGMSRDALTFELLDSARNPCNASPGSVRH